MPVVICMMTTTIILQWHAQQAAAHSPFVHCKKKRKTFYISMRIHFLASGRKQSQQTNKRLKKRLKILPHVAWPRPTRHGDRWLALHIRGNRFDISSNQVSRLHGGSKANNNVWLHFKNKIHLHQPSASCRTWR